MTKHSSGGGSGGAVGDTAHSSFSGPCCLSSLLYLSLGLDALEVLSRLTFQGDDSNPRP